MNLSDYTMEVLDNFSTINPGMKFPKGSVIRTMSPQRNMFAIATVEEEFPKEVCVYDMKRFLSTVQLFDEPNIKFNENSFSISSKNSKVDYTYCAESMIHTPPSDKQLALPKVDGEFDLEWPVIQKVLQASGVLQLEEIIIWAEDGDAYIGVYNTEDSTSDRFQYEIDGFEGDDFKVVILSENLKIIKDDYRVKVCAKGLVEFKGDRVQYFISCEAK